MIEAPLLATTEYQKTTSKEFKDLGKTDTNTPFFTTDKYFPYMSEMESQFSSEKAKDIIKKRLAGDIKSQLWELREGELPYEYNIHLMNVEGEDRMVHESDLATKIDLPLGVSEKIRKGAEKSQILEAKRRAIDAKPGTTFFIPSPKCYERDETMDDAPYVDSILTVMYKFDESTISCRQYLIKKDTPNFAAPEMADLINKLNKKNIIDRNSNINEILMAIGEVNEMVTNSQIWEKIEQITGKPFLSKSTDELSEEEEIFEQYAEEGAEYIYHLLKSGVNPPSLEYYYAEMMQTYLEDVESSKIIRSEFGDISFDTSCGSFGFGSIINGVWPIEEEKKPDMWCTKCKDKIPCSDGKICYKPTCRGILSTNKPYYENYT